MKKFCSVLLIIVVLFSLSACGGPPDGMSDEVYDLGNQALRLMEDYHAGKISAENVKAPLESIRGRLQSISKRDKGVQTGSKYSMNNDQYAFNMSIHISSFLYKLDFMDSVIPVFDDDTYDAYNKLKDILNK